MCTGPVDGREWVVNWKVCECELWHSPDMFLMNWRKITKKKKNIQYCWSISQDSNIAFSKYVRVLPF